MTELIEDINHPPFSIGTIPARRRPGSTLKEDEDFLALIVEVWLRDWVVIFMSDSNKTTDTVQNPPGGILSGTRDLISPMISPEIYLVGM